MLCGCAGSWCGARRAWVAGCPRSLSSARSRGTPAARGAASAAPPAASGSATRRRRARAGPFGVQRAGQLFVTGFVDCGRVFSRRQTRAPDRFGLAFGSTRTAFEQLSFALWQTVRLCTAARSGGIESVSARFCINIKGAQKLLRSTSRVEHYWRSTSSCSNLAAGLHSTPSSRDALVIQASARAQSQLQSDKKGGTSARAPSARHRSAARRAGGQHGARRTNTPPPQAETAARRRRRHRGVRSVGRRRRRGSGARARERRLHARRGRPDAADARADLHGCLSLLPIIGLVPFFAGRDFVPAGPEPVLARIVQSKNTQTGNHGPYTGPMGAARAKAEKHRDEAPSSGQLEPILHQNGRSRENPFANRLDAK